MAQRTRNASDQRPDDLPRGTRIGRYRIARVVGRGGMGTVYRAFDEDTKRDVAVKILRPGLPDLLRNRFLAECEAEAKIRHPHVMPVYDRGTFEDNRLYFVMALVYEPITLTDVVDANMKGLLAQKWPRLRHWARTQRIVLDVLVPICEGVDVSNHEHGILHRDLKPDNVLIDVRTRRPYLIDFGICRRMGSPSESRKIIGTPRFLSPEQALGRVDERTDVWGLGALFFYVLAGRPPIEASSPLRQEERAERIADLGKEEAEARERGDRDRAAELCARRAALEDPDLRTVDDILRDAREGSYAPLPDSVPAPARAIVAKAMARDPKERYESAATLAEDLRAWATGGRVQALSEQHTAGAAVAAAQRTVRRHVVTALWVLLGLAIGIPIGAGLRSSEDAGMQQRVADVLAEVEGLGRETDQLAALGPDSMEGAVAWRWVRDRIGDAAERVAELPEGASRAQAQEALARFEARLAPPHLLLQRRPGRAWHHHRLFTENTRQIDADDIVVAPGPYWILSNRVRGVYRVRIPVWVPLVVGTDGTSPPAEVRMDLDSVPSRIPEGMCYVPGGPPTPGESPLPAFLITFAEVTCLEYAEWLDELDDEERAARSPPEGFVADPECPGRYLVVRDWEDRPVTRIRPEDAAAFAAWRSEVYGARVRLPTEAEWRRAAGGALLDPAHARFFRGMQADGHLVLPDRGPYGAEGFLSAPAEIVTTDEGYGVKGVSAGLGIPPSAKALARTDEVPADTRVAAGFRLVQPIR